MEETFSRVVTDRFVLVTSSLFHLSSDTLRTEETLLVFFHHTRTDERTDWVESWDVLLLGAIQRCLVFLLFIIFFPPDVEEVQYFTV